jgi:glycine/D-amino acid oxidase-like deaminating enzyme
VNKTTDIAVVGGGIAGLAIAELFSRDGSKVVLLERNPKLCMEASAAQHGWFHFGSLYSIFPQNQFLRTMVGGVEDLLQFYDGFDGMNIKISPEGHLNFPQGTQSWFRDEPIEYLISARNDPDFNLFKFEGLREYGRKLFFLATWELAIKQFISRHRRFLKHDWNGKEAASQWIPRAGIADYSREVIHKPSDDATINLDRDTHFQVLGYDRPMQSRNIALSLAARLQEQNGEVRTNSEVTSISKTGENLQRINIADGSSLDARKVVVAAGQWLNSVLGGDLRVKTVVSPLIIAYPAVCDRNFVRMTPFVGKSINHLWHEVDGRKYSIIGGGHYADPANENDVARILKELREKAEAVFPALKSASIQTGYSGYKSELVNKADERNYQYFIREVDDNVFAALPGKFSLSFSLAVNLYKAVTGHDPKPAARRPVDSYPLDLIGLSRHAEIVSKA